MHRAGEKVFMDDAGKRPHIVDRATSEAIAVELFVAVLGAANFTYAMRRERSGSPTGRRSRDLGSVI